MRLRFELLLDLAFLAYLVYTTGSEFSNYLHSFPQARDLFVLLLVLGGIPLLVSDCKKNIFKRLMGNKTFEAFGVLVWIYRAIFLLGAVAGVGWVAYAFVFLYYVQILLALRAVKILYCENMGLSNG